MQILGIFEDKNILYINRLSDFFASVLDGHPLRIDHDGKASGIEDKQRGSLNDFLKIVNFDSKYLKDLKLKPNFFKSLLSAYGVSPKIYAETASKNDPYKHMWIMPTKSLDWILKYSWKMTKQAIIED